MPSASHYAAAQERVAQQALARARYQAGERNVGETFDIAADCWSAPRVEAIEAVAQRLAGHEAQANAFRQSPRGRFLACVDALEALGFDAEAYRLRGFYNRSISTLNGPEADQAAIGDCLLILNGIEHGCAREGIDALAELLTVEVQEAA